MSSKPILQCIFIFTIITAILNIFIIDWYSVPSNSMAPTLSNGSIIIVSKGVKINSLFSFFISQNVRKQDIIVFIKPEWNKDIPDSRVYVKRCVGLPGDTIVIHHKRLQPNVSPIPGQASVMYLFPQDTLFKNWTLTDYGPFLIPKKMQTISLTSYNLRLYRNFIEFENKNFEIVNGRGTVNGKIISSYTFKHNYYFMLGDNFLQSEDSRYWGCVPDVSLLGKVIWHS